MTPPENGTKQAIEDIRAQLNRLWAEKASREALGNALDDISEIKNALQAIEQRFADRARERQQERETAARQREQDRKEAELAAKAAAHERKRDWQYKVGLALTCTGLLITAMAYLLPALGGGG